MATILNLLRGILEQGMVYGVLALGIYITYSILDYPDLSVDGTFPLGAAVTVTLILHGVNPWIAMICAFLAGALAGFFTGIFHVIFRIKDLLSGIITMTALYSINLRIAGSATLPLTLKNKTIFNSGIKPFLLGLFPKDSGVHEFLSKYMTLIIIIFCVLVMKFLLDWYLKTKSGMLLRATGDNTTMVTLLAQNSGVMKIIGLMLCNGLAAVSGAILAQQQRYFESTMGTGMLVMGLASVIIGMTLFSKIRIPLSKRSKFTIKATSAVLLGSIVYKACLAIALNANINPNDLKFIMASIFLIALVGKDLFSKGGRKHA